MKYIAFWPYDQFPFTLWGEIDMSRPHKYTPETLFYVPSYQMYARAFMILNEDEAKPIIKRIEELNKNYNKDISEVCAQYKQVLKEVIPAHPNLKK
jgi:hypothetical protein